MIDIVRTIIVIWLLAITALVTLLQRIDPDTHVKMFCAYGKTFIEFKEGKSVWGSMWLDDHGSPIPCNEEDTVTVKGNQTSI